MLCSKSQYHGISLHFATSEEISTYLTSIGGGLTEIFGLTIDYLKILNELRSLGPFETTLIGRPFDSKA